MSNQRLMQLAHIKVKRIRKEYEVDYHAQLGIILKRLHYVNNLNTEYNNA